MKGMIVSLRLYSASSKSLVSYLIVGVKNLCVFVLSMVLIRSNSGGGLFSPVTSTLGTSTMYLWYMVCAYLISLLFLYPSLPRTSYR